MKLKKTFKKKYLELIDVLIFDFDGVLTNNYVFTNQEGVESVMCNRNDGLGFEILKKLKKKIYIISSEKNPVVYARSKKLKIKCIQGSENKKNTLIKLVKKNRHDFKKILYVGNDINDYEAMKLCKFSACPADSHYLIKKQSNFILKKKGGEGVVTEILEKIFNLNLVKYI